MYYQQARAKSIFTRLAVVTLVFLLCWIGSINIAKGCGGTRHSFVNQKNDDLTLTEAREYMLSLINRDRVSLGFMPVELDEIGTYIAQQHSDDMCEHGYLSHWDLKGRKPDQRYSEAGGTGAVFENVYTNHNNPFLGLNNELSDEPLFPRVEIEAAEAWFFNQTPPSDAHRRNILDAHHRRVGIGISLSRDKRFGSRITVAQEFVNLASDTISTPSELVVGKAFELSGVLDKGISLHAIQICREDFPRALTLEEVRNTRSYSIPQSDVQNYFPFPTRLNPPVKIKKTEDKETFLLSFRPQDAWRSGLYYVVVWANTNKSDAPFIASVRTIPLVRGTQMVQVANAN